MILDVVVWHGEGGTLFYVVDTAAPDDDQPAVLATFWQRWEAEAHIADLIDQDRAGQLAEYRGMIDPSWPDHGQDGTEYGRT
jgi:hypothetical protein